MVLSCLTMKLAMDREYGNDRVTPRDDLNSLNSLSAQNCNGRKQTNGSHD